jgi:hypothetical protein
MRSSRPPFAFAGKLFFFAFFFRAEEPFLWILLFLFENTLEPLFFRAHFPRFAVCTLLPPPLQKKKKKEKRKKKKKRLARWRRKKNEKKRGKGARNAARAAQTQAVVGVRLARARRVARAESGHDRGAVRGAARRQTRAAE